jgi:hypothetical protein
MAVPARPKASTVFDHFEHWDHGFEFRLENRYTSTFLLCCTVLVQTLRWSNSLPKNPENVLSPIVSEFDSELKQAEMSAP